MDRGPVQIPELQVWLEFFRARSARSISLPWFGEAPLTRRDAAAVGRSIATFQLGESSDGTHLIEAARRFAARHALPGLEETTALFIREEQFHARLLLEFMQRNGIPTLHSQWSDHVFRRLRHLSGFEVALAVLISAELIALTYYRALSEATPSQVLRAICEQILEDERAHVEYESTLILRCRSHQPRAASPLAGWARRVFYAGTILVVFLGHARVLRAGGLSFPEFWQSCWNDFDSCFAHGRAPETVHVST